MTDNKTEKALRTPQTDAPGYVAARLRGSAVGDSAVGKGADGTIYADADGFTYTVGA